MATTIRPSPVPTPPTSSPPTPPTNYPTFPRLSSPSINRNASTSSSRSTATTSSTSSVQAAPMRPPPIETSTAATTPSQLPSRPVSRADDDHSDASRRGYGGSGPELGSVGGRGWGRNGPRSGRMTPQHIITTPSHSPSPILNSSTSTRPTTSGSMITVSPTTPRGLRFPVDQDPTSPGPLRVTISLDPMDTLNHDHHQSNSPPSNPSSPVRGREGHLTAPSSPTIVTRSQALMDGKQRTLSVDAGPSWTNGRRSGSIDRDRERERRQSQISNHSHSGSGQIKKPSIRDFVLGEELGQGSYSTVYAATAASSSSSQSPTSARLPRKYAIKIINQHHLVQEKKVKYAMIERDALVRLSTPRQSVSPTTARGHRRGLSSSSSGGYGPSPSTASKRKSVASINSSAGTARKDSGATVVPGGRDRISIVTTDSGLSSSPLSNNAPLSPVTKNFAGRRPSRNADHPDMVPEQTEMLSSEQPEVGIRSSPPSPVKEESTQIQMSTPPQFTTSKADDYLPPPTPGYATTDIQGSPVMGYEAQPRHSREGKGQTPKKRRQSLAPSERSVKSGSGKPGQAHPGVIRLHSTFNDSTSLYFVLDLASNGELASYIRKFGSLDMISAKYYSAQLIDTIEFMHEKGVVHRDLKPENILLDDEKRIKITDFGSAKLMNKEEEPADDGKKRSFVGSADFVSPEVLRNEPASPASDIWAFGCILYQFLAGKPPFRGATDYLTFQKILKREMDFPEGFDDDAKALVELVLNLDPHQRPSVQDIKSHAFFALTNWSTIFTNPAPPIVTGLTQPAAALANLAPDSDPWAVFDDEVSDGGFEYDRDEDEEIVPNEGMEEDDHTNEPRIDRNAAAYAVRNVDYPGNSVIHTPDDGPHIDITATERLDPPRPAYATESSSSIFKDSKKNRGWSHGSSSSGGNRSALTGWLESMRIGGGTTQQHNYHNSIGTPGIRSNRTSRTSVRSDEMRIMMGSQTSSSQGTTPVSSASFNPPATSSKLGNDDGRRLHLDNNTGDAKWSSLLLSNERIIFSSQIQARTSSPSLHLPSFLMPAFKKRQLILTDFPRLIIVKDDSLSSSNVHAQENHDEDTLKVKGECVFVVRPSNATGISEHSNASTAQQHTQGQGTDVIPNKVIDVQEKGTKGFIVQTAGTTYLYNADTQGLRDEWLTVIKRVTGL
ncbi:uncharacterized protein IL334_002903 [Kwoniella shivajii]|uniref:non-specific serine/threonine protein kinase n=1 Tax=Kwoniella shivajii TaxID=564305 RepID=A0ABZ1D070_9TREE|nr:hypothetical protein IL334_002903 [Kwoniella shivajii]